MASRILILNLKVYISSTPNLRAQGQSLSDLIPIVVFIFYRYHYLVFQKLL